MMIVVVVYNANDDMRVVLPGAQVFQRSLMSIHTYKQLLNGWSDFDENLMCFETCSTGTFVLNTFRNYVWLNKSVCGYTKAGGLVT